MLRLSRTLAFVFSEELPIVRSYARASFRMLSLVVVLARTTYSVRGLSEVVVRAGCALSEAEEAEQGSPNPLPQEPGLETLLGEGPSARCRRRGRNSF